MIPTLSLAKGRNLLSFSLNAVDTPSMTQNTWETSRLSPEFLEFPPPIHFFRDLHERTDGVQAS